MRTFGWVALGLVAVVGGCGKKDKDSGGEVLSADLVMTDANSYSYTGDMQINPIAVASGTDATVDWCALTTDIRGRDVDPNQIDRMVLIELDLTQEEAMNAIEANDLTQADTVTQWIFQNETARGCTAALSDFAILGNAFDPTDFVQSGHTWLLSATYFEDSRFDFVMTAFIVPTDNEPNTTVTLTDASATLTADSDLHTPTPIRTQAGLGDYTLDWSGVDKDVYGKDFDDNLGNQVLIGRVDVATVEEIEAIFLRVDTEAAEIYRLNEIDGVPVVYGETSADLMQATDATGKAFGGFTTEGIWLVGIECTTCTSPAPLLLSVVEVAE